MKLRFLIALAVGYVLGARAGRGRYDEIVARVDELMDSDLVRQLRQDVLGTAGQPDAEAHAVTPPVIVGPGPAGTGVENAADVQLPDVEPSSAGNAPDADAAARARRLNPPGT